jgi:hypothetical protein
MLEDIPTVVDEVAQPELVRVLTLLLASPTEAHVIPLQADALEEALM